MSSSGSVTNWIRGVREGDEGALRRLWERYLPRLVELARTRLGNLPRRVGDEEDVVQVVFTAFWHGLSHGRFPQLHDRTDLWNLLFAITLHKIKDLRDYLTADRRANGLVRGDSAFAFPAADGSAGLAGAAIDPEPTPDAAAQFLEEYERLLALLGDEHLRAVAQWKMAGHTNEEIAAKLGCVPRTVERRLNLIRNLWEEEMAR